MSTWAEVGKRCVCVHDEFPEIFGVDVYSLPVRVPMINEVLTIREVRAIGAFVYLRFDEIELRQTSGPLGGDIWWGVACFRPIEDRKTDISIFTSMLTPAGRVKADADA